MIKNQPANAGVVSLIPGMGRSFGEANGNLLQYSWEIPWTEKPWEGYNAWGCKRIGHYLATKQQQQQNTEKRTFIKKQKFRSIPLYLARGNNRDNMWLFPGSSDSKESACKCRRPGSVPGLGRPPGGGNGNPFRYSGLENSMDRRTWRATVHGLAESDMTERPTLSTFRDNVIL